MTHPIPKYLIETEAYWDSVPGATGYMGYGLRYADGSRLTFGATRDPQEAHDQAQALAEERSLPLVEQDHRPREAKRQRAEEDRRQQLQAIAAEPLTFRPVEEARALPTIGGILSDEAYEKVLKHFPREVMVPLSDRLARKLNDGVTRYPPAFLVTRHEGRGVAVTPLEAEAFGLEEAPNWVPDLTGAPCAPTREDLEAALTRRR